MQRVFNLTVNRIHTYYTLAGDAPVLVHNTTCPTGFADLGGDYFTSPAGLVYGRIGSNNQHRIDHIMEHASPKPNKPDHDMFNTIDQDEILRLVDEAWRKKGSHVPGDPGAYIVDLYKEIGTVGQTKMKVVVIPGSNPPQIVTAYPWRH